MGFAKNPADPIEDLGILTDLKTVKDSGDNYYKFRLASTTPVSIFLNGLSAGYRVELQDANGAIIIQTSNHGTKRNVSDAGETDGAIVISLNPGNYLVHVTPITFLRDDVYRVKDGSYTLNLIPDNAPNTVVVAASDSPVLGTVKFNATGEQDNKIINEAIDVVGKAGGGRVLLRPGTYHIFDNVKTTYDNLTVMGTGWKTILKLADNVKMEGAGLLRSRFLDNRSNDNKDYFTNQHFIHLVLDGNKANGTFFVNSVGNYGTYVDSSIEDVRAHDFPRYGLDPHESLFEELPFGSKKMSTPSNHFLIKDSLIDHNGQDGIVFENTIDSTIVNNIVDSNHRHGINIVTESVRNQIKSNIISNNGANGLTIQPGQDIEKESNDNQVEENTITGNQKNGLHIYRSKNTKIIKNTIDENGYYGIHLRASTNSEVIENSLNDNARASVNMFSGINLSGDETVFATYNLIAKNSLRASSLNTYKFGIVEHDAMNDFNQVIGNRFQSIKKPVRMKGPHSVAKDNEV